MAKYFFTLGISGGAWLGGSVVDVAGARGGLWLVIAAAWAILAVVLIGLFLCVIRCAAPINAV